VRKSRILLILIVLALGFVAISFSEDQQQKTDQPVVSADSGMMPKCMMMQQGQREGMQPMPCMMKSMMEKSVVATEDGGVIVLIGNKLLKYDKDLNLQKEVEIKIDMAAMKEKMMPMQGKDMQPGGMMQGETKEEKPVEAQRR